VTDLIGAYFQNENPLSRGWEIHAATLNLYMAPAQGKSRSPLVSVEVTSKGRLNLHKFDEKLRTQLEGYLVHLEILEPKDALDYQASNATAIGRPMSLFE
jgi:predicted ArsR family transcriptional regulator